MLRVLTTDNVDIFPAFPPHAFTTIAEFLHRAADFHSSDLLESLDGFGDAEGAQSRNEGVW